MKGTLSLTEVELIAETMRTEGLEKSDVEIFPYSDSGELCIFLEETDTTNAPEPPRTAGRFAQSTLFAVILAASMFVSPFNVEAQREPIDDYAMQEEADRASHTAVDREVDRNSWPPPDEYTRVYYCLPSEGLLGDVSGAVEESLNHELEERGWNARRVECDGIDEAQGKQEPYEWSWFLTKGATEPTPRMKAMQATIVGICKRNELLEDFNEAVHKEKHHTVLVDCYWRKR